MLDLDLPIEDRVLERLYAYWQEKRGGRRFPARADLDPVDFAYALGWVILADVSHDPLRFYIRLYGSELAQRAGFDVTGTYLHDHPQPEFRTYVEKEWRETVERAEPTHGHFDRWVETRRYRFETVRLPLSTDGRNIDMLLIAVRHKDARRSSLAD